MLRLVFSLYHPNIVSFYGYSLEKTTMGLLMELGVFSMDNLIHRCLRKNVVVRFSTKIKILLGVARGVEYLHDPNIAVIHRDLKWDNVIITPSGMVKLIDFGEMKQNSGSTMKTNTFLKGTNWFISPEIVCQDKKDKVHYSNKVDQFSFSIMMYTLLFDVFFGKPKFELSELFYGNVRELMKDPYLRPDLEKFKEKVGKKKNSVQKWIVDLMKQCWDPIPETRPEFSSIVKVLEYEYKLVGGPKDDLNLLIQELEKLSN